MPFDFDAYYRDMSQKYGEGTLNADTVASLAFMKTKKRQPQDTLDSWAEREGFLETLNGYREQEHQTELATERQHNVEETSSLMRGLKSGVDKTQAFLYEHGGGQPESVQGRIFPRAAERSELGKLF
jgi:hypothetical protein